MLPVRVATPPQGPLTARAPGGPLPLTANMIVSLARAPGARDTLVNSAESATSNYRGEYY